MGAGGTAGINYVPVHSLKGCILPQIMIFFVFKIYWKIKKKDVTGNIYLVYRLDHMFQDASSYSLYPSHNSSDLPL